VKILLAIDSSSASQVAVQEVIDRPWPPGTTVEVVSVVDTYCGWNGPEVFDALMDAGRQAVESHAAVLITSGLTSRSKVLCGDPKTMVVDYASETGADLLIVGSHDASDLTRFLLGSVARAVVRHAACSVEVVRPRSGNGGMKIMIASDGSEFSENAVRVAASRPWPPNSEFRIVSVAELPAMWFAKPYPAFLDSKAMENLRAQAMQRAEKAVAAAERIFADAGFAESATEAVPYASAPEVILSQAEEWSADLIVAGSHGHRGVRHLLLGSTAEQLALHATCSVEIVRARN
jgi:nucleotide-binding universal stress UspA family protein